MAAILTGFLITTLDWGKIRRGKGSGERKGAVKKGGGSRLGAISIRIYTEVMEIQRRGVTGKRE